MNKIVSLKDKDNNLLLHATSGRAVVFDDNTTAQTLKSKVDEKCIVCDPQNLTKDEQIQTQKNIGVYNTANLVYGVRINTENSSPILERTGNMNFHVLLPIQSKMRRCILDDEGHVVYYLDQNDSTKKADGTAAVLDGTDGQVMVEIPEHYRGLTIESNVAYRVEISEYPFDGAIRVPKMYVSAYEAVIDRTNNKLCSIVNMDPQYRGGNNQSDWDGTYKSMLGMPVTVKSLTAFRTAANARGAGWGCYDYAAHLALYWLFTIEYANRNCQATYNATTTAEGYHQGGLGPGVTNFGDAKWSAYNGYYPLVKCGFTNSLGNNTGYKTFTLDSEQQAAYGGEHSEQVPSYRGVENPFGHIWKWTDGYLTLGNGTNAPVYICRDPKYYGSSISKYYSLVGTPANSNGYSKNWIRTPYADMVVESVGGGSTTYNCDYYYTASANGTTFGLLLGGYALYGSSAGFSCVLTRYVPSYTSASIGSRLCWRPA